MRDLEAYLQHNAAECDFPAGTLICAEGRQADAAYYIRKGRVRVFQQRGNDRSVVASLGPGAIFGEMALVRFDTYTLSVEAETDVCAYVISPGYLHDKLRGTDPLVRAILDAAIDRVYDANLLLLDLEKSAGVPSVMKNSSEEV